MTNGETTLLDKVLEQKAARRKELTKLPVAEKLIILGNSGNFPG
ncbi:MAG TPA: hypothetical protein VFC63_09385 [Blastocatellia bacterium]|nr:hypothetical protein [Blastocatellia bacterium]